MRSLTGAMFFMATAQFMGSYMMTTTTFQGERPVFLREYANKMYNVFPYYIAKLLGDIPGFIIGPLIFCLWTYFTIGFQLSAEQFFGYWAALTLDSFAAISLGYMISSMFTLDATA